MTSIHCQPCELQNKQVSAPYWCLQCEHPLCMMCRNYHKVLKITQNHIIVESGDYKIILEFLSSIKTKCDHHSNEEMGYFCTYHAVACCILCKESFHSSCIDVNMIEDTNCNEKIYTEMQSLLETLMDRINILDQICTNKAANIQKLESQNEEFLKDIKQKRKEIDSALDKLESDLRAKFNVEYQFQRGKIQTELDSYMDMNTCLKSRHEQLTKIINIKPLTAVELFFAKDHLDKQSRKDEDTIKQGIEGLHNISCECTISVTIDDTHRHITVEDKMSVASFKSKIDYLGEEIKVQSVCDKNEDEDANSSTVENEELFLDETNFGGNPQKTKGPTSGIISKTYFGKVHYQHQKHFLILRKIPTTAVTCFKHLPNGHFIFGERSVPRLLIYEQSGFKKGDIKLQETPQSVAVIDENRVAVTVGHKVIVADFLRFTIEKVIPLDSKCYGIACINNTLVVNCETNGLHVLTLFGQIVKKIRFTCDILFLTAFRPNTVVSVKRGSEMVHFFNIETLKLIAYKCPHLTGAAGITSDSNNNIYVSCDQSDKIYMLPCGTDRWVSILGSHDYINRPWSIDYNNKTNELYVINEGGKAIYTYKKT